MPGIYAPLTQSSNFYIKVGQNHKTLAHSYAYIQNPQFYEPFCNMIFTVWETLYGKPTSSEVHPAADWMKNTFYFLLSGK